MNLRSPKAVTLIEILVVVGILSGVITAVYTVLAVGNRSWLTYHSKLVLEGEARWALFAMVKDLREAQGILITQDAETVAIRFKKPQSGVMSFIFNKNGRNANTLIRETNDQEKILAHNIVDLSFDYTDSRALGIVLRAEKKIFKEETMNFHLQEKITLRR